MQGHNMLLTVLTKQYLKSVQKNHIQINNMQYNNTLLSNNSLQKLHT